MSTARVMRGPGWSGPASLPALSAVACSTPSCADADALAEFWSVALGYRREAFDPPYVRLTDPRKRWPDLLLQQVPEPKTAKNRMHLDLQVLDADAEAGRLVAAGARIVEPAHDDDGYRTVILADPQGNEFCVLRPPPGGARWTRSVPRPADPYRLGRMR